MKIILLGHGHCASGYLSALELIAGSQESVEAIDFTASMTSTELEERLEAAVQDEKEIIVLCDLLGGTPFKIASARALRSNSQQIEVLSGLNLSMLLEVVLGDSALTDDRIEKVMTSAKNGIISAKALFSQPEETEIESEEGI